MLSNLENIKLPETIYLRIIKEAVLNELKKTSKEKSIWKINKEKMLFSLLKNTRCTGCGTNKNVCLNGYCNEYCDKLCWIHNRLNNYDEHPLENLYNKYEHLENYDLSSKAYSTYNHKENHKVWPMIKNRVCDNWCINNKEKIKVI